MDFSLHLLIIVHKPTVYVYLDSPELLSVGHVGALSRLCMTTYRHSEFSTHANVFEIQLFCVAMRAYT